MQKLKMPLSNAIRGDPGGWFSVSVLLCQLFVWGFFVFVIRDLSRDGAGFWVGSVVSAFAVIVVPLLTVIGTLSTSITLVVRVFRKKNVRLALSVMLIWIVIDAYFIVSLIEA